MKKDLMLIGEIAEFFGVSRKAIRIYEKKGIIKPAKVDEQNGYRYYSAEHVQQLNALLELKTLGFSLEEIKTVTEGMMPKEEMILTLERKQRVWQEAVQAAEYKAECLGNIIQNIKHAKNTDNIVEMTEEERAWFLVRMVCVEDVNVQKALSEALWL